MKIIFAQKIKRPEALEDVTAMHFRHASLTGCSNSKEWRGHAPGTLICDLVASWMLDPGWQYVEYRVVSTDHPSIRLADFNAVEGESCDRR